MWRITGTTFTREECLRRALQEDWMSENVPSRDGAARAWAMARKWRSLALVAKASAEQHNTRP